jgi:hypothetical protein
MLHASRETLVKVGTLAIVLSSIGGTGSSASAAFVLGSASCAAEAGKHVALCWAETETGPLRELSGEESFTASSELVELRATLGSELAVEMVCKGNGTGSIAQAEPLAKNYSISKFRLMLNSCRLEGVLGTKCRVPPELFTAELVVTPSTAASIRLSPSVGKTIMEITFENEGLEPCPATILGLRKLTGSQPAEFLFAATPALNHSFETLLTTETLLDEREAKLSMFAQIHLSSLTDHWDIIETA